MRMSMRRFTRLTNAYSKKLLNLKAQVALHFAHYNFVRVHSSLRVTPAMEAGWTTARRVVAKVEFHAGELFPRLGFIVTNLELPSRAVVRFYNKRGTAEQWIKEGKLAVSWTRLPCHRFRGNEVRLWLSVIPTFSGRLALPNRIRNWSLTSLQQRLVKTGGRLVPPRGMRVISGCCWPKGI